MADRHHTTSTHKIGSKSRWTRTIFVAEARVERRLAAILAVDVAGYSRLMGDDEEGTLAALRAVWRELADPSKCPEAATARRNGNGSVGWSRAIRPPPAGMHKAVELWH